MWKKWQCRGWIFGLTMYVLAFHCHRYWHWFCITAVRFTSATNILIDEFGETWGFWQQFQCWRCNDTYSYAFMVMICNVMHTTDFLWGSVMAVMQYNTLIVTPLHVTVDLNLGYWSVLDGTRDIGLNDVIAFWTGANTVPPMGFQPGIIQDGQSANKPLSVEFYRGDDDGRLPYSSTCGLTIWLPLGCEMEDFERRLTMAFTDCRGFGKVWNAPWCCLPYRRSRLHLLYAGFWTFYRRRKQPSKIQFSVS